MSDENQNQNSGENQNSGNEGANKNDGKWYSSLPESYHSDVSITRYNGLEEFVKSRAELEKKVGANTVVIPDFTKATDEEISNFATKLGRPASAEEYKLQVPDGITVSEEELKAFKEDAFKALLTPKKANDLFVSIMDRRKQALNQDHMINDRKTKESFEQAKQRLNSEWGAENYDKNKQIADYAFNKYADENTKKALNDAGLTEHPEFVKLFFKVGKTLSEGTLPDGPGKQGVTIADAQRRMTEMRADPKGAFMDGRHPGHKEAVAEYTELNRMVYNARNASGTP